MVIFHNVTPVIEKDYLLHNVVFGSNITPYNTFYVPLVVNIFSNYISIKRCVPNWQSTDVYTSKLRSHYKRTLIIESNIPTPVLLNLLN